MAEKRTIDINIKNNADEATQDFNTFNDALDQTAKSAKNVNSTFEEVYGELQPLTTRLGEAEDRLYELALAGDTTSKEYQELLTKVGEYRKVQIQTDLAVDGAATTMTQKLGSALNAATSGFTATQGAIALFGEENEALNESLLKVQSALAIQQGVQGLTEAYRELGIGTKIAGAAQAAFTFVTGGASTALKVFRAALVSTGIGAIVVGLGLLIANFEKVSKFVGDAIKSFDKLSGVMKIILFPITAIIEGFKLVNKGLQALGITQSEAEKEAEKRNEASKARYEAEKKRLDESKKQLEKQAQAQKKYTEAYLGELEIRRRMAKKNGDDIKAIDEEILAAQIQSVEDEKENFLESKRIRLKEIQALEKRLLKLYGANSAKYKTQVRLNQEYEQRIRNEDWNEIKIFNNRVQTLRLDNEEKEAESLERRRQKYREYRDNRLQTARQIEDLENELLEEGIEKELEINRDKFRRLREDAEKNTKLTLEERRRLNDLYTEQEAKSEAEIRNKFRNEELQKEIDFFTENKLPVLQAIADEEVKVEINKWSLIGQAQAEAYKKEEALRKRNQDFAVQTTLDGLSLISDITELFGKKGEKQAKRAFQVQKAAQIAAATIETYLSAQKAYTSQLIPGDPTSPVRAGIAAGVAVAAGLANIAKIASQKFEGGGSSGGGADFSGGGVGGGETVAPQFNVVGDSGINQLAQLQQQPTQAYVVSGEVTSAQALDRNRVTNATL